MTRIPTSDPIEYLVEQRFPAYKALQIPPFLTSGRLGGGLSADEHQKRLQEVENYRASLRAKTPEELAAMVEQKRAAEMETWRLKAEKEERERFFNQPYANADFSHWSKATYWTLDEALALAFGKAPEVMRWEKVKEHVGVSAFARQYARVRDLAVRAKNWNQLFDPVLPGIFLAWARRTEIEVPEALIKAVEARGIVIGDWKDNYDKLKVQHDMLLADRDKIAAICRTLIEERDALKRRAAELEAQASAWQFDDAAENYPAELDIAMQAWRAVTTRRDATGTVKQQVSAWLSKSYPKLSDEARERIATICNWEKRGGRRPQG